MAIDRTAGARRSKSTSLDLRRSCNRSRDLTKTPLVHNRPDGVQEPYRLQSCKVFDLEATEGLELPASQVRRRRGWRGTTATSRRGRPKTLRNPRLRRDPETRRRKLLEWGANRSPPESLCAGQMQMRSHRPRTVQI